MTDNFVSFNRFEYDKVEEVCIRLDKIDHIILTYDKDDKGEVYKTIIVNALRQDFFEINEKHNPNFNEILTKIRNS